MTSEDTKNYSLRRKRITTLQSNYNKRRSSRGYMLDKILRGQNINALSTEEQCALLFFGEVACVPKDLDKHFGRQKKTMVARIACA